jgi:integrase
MTIKLKLPKYVDGFEDRYGHARYYFRRKGGPRIPLPGLPWTPEFMAAYQAAADGQAIAKVAAHRVIPGTIEHLIVDYVQCDAWENELSAGSRKFRRAILEQFRAKLGTAKTRAINRTHIQAIIANRKPSAQGNWMKTLRHLFKFAVADNRIAVDPTQGVSKKQAPKTGGFRPWTEDDVTTFRTFYEIGTRERLAMELMLNLGIRVSDACQIGPRDIRHGVLAEYRPQKGRATGGHAINVPVHADLAKVIAGTKVAGVKTFLVAERGGAFNSQYLSERMREWCDAAGLPRCTSHGLRKLCLTRLAEAGCSVFEIMSVSGHKNIKEVQTYVDAANRKKMAVTAMGRLQTAKD